MLDPLIYALAHLQPMVFDDVVTGNDDIQPGIVPGTDYPATPGFDLATGWGSPRIAAFAEASQTLAAAHHGAS